MHLNSLYGISLYYLWFNICFILCYMVGMGPIIFSGLRCSKRLMVPKNLRLLLWSKSTGTLPFLWYMFPLFMVDTKVLYVYVDLFLNIKITPCKQENCKSSLSTLGNNCASNEGKPLIYGLRFRSNFILYFKDLIYLLLERGERREK